MEEDGSRERERNESGVKKGDGGGEKGRGIKERQKKGGGKRRVTRGKWEITRWYHAELSFTVVQPPGNIHILLQTECRVLTLPRA